jgi:hypothetical protein
MARFPERPRPLRPLHSVGRRAALLVAGLVLVAAACSSASDSAGGGEIRDFSEVQASEMAFEVDPSDPSRAIFRVTTSEPMICAIVWGETDEFGRFNNSLAMSGTGIEQHDVVLPDVEPGTDYRFVVQGTTADGRLYRSEIGTFNLATTPTPEAVDRGENLALDATIVDVSSEFGTAFAASNAIDGDTATEWATSGDGDGGSITIDLGSDREIGGVEFVTRSMADGSSITETFTVSIDDGDPLGPFPAGTVADPRFSEVAGTGRVLRFDVERSTGGNVGAVEIRVFGPTG